MPKSRPSHRQSDRFELWWWWHGSSWIHLSKHLLTVEGTQNFGSLYRADPANAFTCHCTKKAPLGMVQHRKLTNVPLQKGKDRLSVPLSFRWHSFVFGGVYALSTNTGWHNENNPAAPVISVMIIGTSFDKLTKIMEQLEWRSLPQRYAGLGNETQTLQHRSGVEMVRVENLQGWFSSQ